MSRKQRLPTYSTARLDTMVCPVFVNSDILQSCLPKQAGLTLPRLPGVPERQHPLIIEIWRVQDGRIEVEGITADRMWELGSGVAGIGFGGSAGATVGAGIGSVAGAANGGAMGMWLGPAGYWWGAAAGAAAGALTGAAMMATAGALSGARWAAREGHKASQRCSRVIGTYNEILATIPCRRIEPPSPADDFAFVLSTHTDSMPSLLGERIVGWGYRKERAIGFRTEEGALEVEACASGALFKLADRQVSPPVPPAQVRSFASPVLESLSHPLLGMLPADRLRVSFMDRSFESPAVRLVSTSLRMEWGDTFFPGLRGTIKNLLPLGKDSPWGAFMVTGLPVILSYPRDLYDGRADKG